MKNTRHWRLLAAVAAVGLLATACSDTGGGSAEDDTPATQDTAMDDSAMDDDAMTGDEAAATVLTLAADTVTGPLNIPDDQRASAVCVLQNRFARNSEIVWRARVFDGTGAELSDTDLTSVVVQLADGQTLDMRFGPHPRDEPMDNFWTTSFDIPVDYPTGTLAYEIVATHADGTTGTFKPFNVTPSLLTITEEVLETIEEAA